MEHLQLLVDRRASAQALGISLRTLDYMIEHGELAARRVGRRVLIPRAALELFARRDHRSHDRTKRRNTVRKASENGAKD